MSFDLTSLFNRQSQIYTQRHTDLSQTTGQVKEGVSVAGKAEMTESLQLSVGTTVSGQVVGISGDMVQIEVTPGMVLNAKVEEGLSFFKGMTASFEVRSVSDNQIALRALFQNTAANMATINKAIDAADLPQNADAVSMVNAMMENGMPIDKGALQDMYRQVVANPTASGENIVAMNRLQIPVTEENLQQFEAYLNLEHQISSGVETIADSLANNLTKLISEGKTGEAAELMKQMSEALGQPSEAFGIESKQVFTDGLVLLKTDEKTAADREVLGSATDATNAANTADAVEPSQRELISTGTAQIYDSSEATAEISVKPQVTASLEELMKGVQILDEPVTDSRIILEDLEKMGVSTDKAQQFVSGGLAGKELLDFTQDLLMKINENPELLTDNLKKHFRDLPQEKNFQQAFRREFFDYWLMKPEDVSDKHKISDFYTRLSEQTGKCMDALQNLPGADKNLLAQVTNIHNNIEFMNQLNQTVSYVQLPLKLAGENAHGDLYVYTNKKGLAREDGNVSAFLHLDMEHLGPVDVYVAMQSQKVSTQFYLKDDEMLDFINENIHMLNQRLEQKGYQMSVQMSVKEKTGSVIEEILEDQKENIRIGEYSFDMRA